MEQREGVIRFRAEHASEPLPAELAAAAARLGGWRRILRGVGVLGQDPHRYGGYGFGNVSARVPPFPTPPGRRRFLVSATQTSGKEAADLADFALVERYDFAANRVGSRGSALPSSEALTHGAIYDLSSEVRAVFHVHAPELWRRAAELDLPTTSPGLREGTAELATEIRRLRPGWVLAAGGLVAMGGHEDGMIAFGRCEEEAGQRLLAALARAYA
jgi:Class II Aldolase and Adducin N-terminal domain